MQGNLYIITNDINEYVYIGKTYVSLNERFKRHISDAKRKDRPNSGKFHKALLQYGSKHFKIELIAQFEEGILEQKEIEYIAKYNSYHNGYNSTLGGEGTVYINFSDDEISDIVNKYDCGDSLAKIAMEYDVSSYTIRKIIISNGRHIQSYEDVSVVRYSKDMKYIKTYNKIRDVLIDITAEGYSSDLRNLYRYIHESCNNGCIRYGSKWRLYSDLSNDEILKNKMLDSNTNRKETIINTRVKRDSSGVTCVELNIHFNTFKEAAEYLVQHGYTFTTNMGSLGYRISQAKKNNTKYLNLTWK